ncbi:MAG TPA: hypothetical protein VMN36_18630 [Verrucomicrobiales bacterium]|nr:hypothetical protein [Verrucomicrobiales bacterium]
MPLAAFLGIQLLWAGVAAALFFYGRSQTGKVSTGDSAPEPVTRSSVSLFAPAAPGEAGAPAPASSAGSTSVFEVGKLSKEAILSLLPAALEERDPVRRMSAISRILSSLDKESIPEALAIFESAPRSEDSERDFRSFMQVWGKVDGASALEYALGEGGNKVRWGASSAIRGWAAQDPAGAKLYLDGMEGSDTKSWLEFGYVTGLAQNDLDGAMTASLEASRSRARGQGIEHLSGEILRQRGPEALKAWVEQIDAGAGEDSESYKQFAFEQAARLLSREDPEAAKVWVEKHAAEGLASADTLRDVAYRSSGDNPQVAADWILSIEAGDRGTEALREVVERWASREPNDTAQWLSERPLDATWDPVVRAFAEGIRNEDPEAAVAWSSIIKDERVRMRSIGGAAREWLQRDFDTARAQLLQSDFIPPEYKERLSNLQAPPNRDG